MPKNDNDAIILTRFNMHYENGKLFFIKNAPFLIVSDHWLIKNDNLEFELNKGKNSFVERLDITGFNVLYSESSNYHFPCIKNWRKVNQDNIIGFDEFMKNGGFDKYLKENRIENLVDRSMIDKNKIIQICKTFNFEKNRILPKE